MTIKGQLGIADHQKAKEDYKRHHGATEGGAFVTGLRRYKPMDAGNNELATGYDYVSIDGKPVTVYDGIITEVDKSVFDHEVAMFEDREKRVNDLVKAFLKAGDILTMKYIGHYFDWLPAEQPKGDDADKWKLMLQREGFRRSQANDMVTKMSKADARPSVIQSYTNPTTEYTAAINKLQWVIKFTCIVFTGQAGIVAPDVPIANQLTLNDNDSKASNKTKMEITKNTGLNIFGLAPP